MALVEILKGVHISSTAWFYSENKESAEALVDSNTWNLYDANKNRDR